MPVQTRPAQHSLAPPRLKQKSSTELQEPAGRVDWGAGAGLAATRPVMAKRTMEVKRILAWSVERLVETERSAWNGNNNELTAYY